MVHTSGVTAEKPPARLRRSGAVLRRRMEAAARLEFTQNGYLRTPLSAVASRAGVRHSVLYRHFASKDVLYGEVIFAPFVEGLERLADQWPARLDTSRGERHQVADLPGDMYRYLRDHRHVLEHLIGGQDALPPTMIERFRTVIDRLAHELQILSDSTTTPRQRCSRAQIDTRLRALIATVLGMATFGSIVAPNRSHDQVIEAVVRHALWGMKRPAADQNGNDDAQDVLEP